MTDPVLHATAADGERESYALSLKSALMFTTI